MKRINKNKIKIKNLLGIVEEPTIEDLLFEIIMFLEDEQKEDFKKWDVTMKTRVRLHENIEDDLSELVEKGYLESLGWTKFKVIKHPWE